MSQVKIERFTSWDEIFLDSSDEVRHYQDLLSGFREDFGDNVDQRAEIDPVTGLALVTFEGKGIYTVVQRLNDRNIRLQFGSDTINEIVPEVGNKKHEWTYDDIRSLREGMMGLHRLAQDPLERTSLYMTIFYLKGKIATAQWEKTYLSNNEFPQRIGYKIYNESALRGAQLCLNR